MPTGIGIETGLTRLVRDAQGDPWRGLSPAPRPVGPASAVSRPNGRKEAFGIVEET